MKKNYLIPLLVAMAAGRLFAADTTYHIPVVFHIVHDYGAEDLPDSIIYNALQVLNTDFLRRNADTSTVIPTYAGTIPGTNVKYIGNPNIEFDLATVDPQGNPTHGITHTRTPQASSKFNELKCDPWPSSRYYNVWIVRGTNNIAGNATLPSQGVAAPADDGALVAYNYTGGASGRIIMTFFTAKFLGLVSNQYNVLNPYHGPGNGCEDDNIDDTPPGANYASCNLYDTTCSMSYNDTLGKTHITLPIAANAYDTSTSNAISFHSRTTVTLKTVTIYPAAPAGTDFKVVLTHNGNIINTWFDTVQVAGTFKVLPLNFRMPSGTGYQLRFAKNPMAHGDAFSNATPQFFPGAIYFDNDINSNGTYNYFYNWNITTGYYKLYANDSLVDYPDTINAQNFMNANACSVMFTHGQAVAMRDTLHSSIANRDLLITATNAGITGILQPQPNLPPVADFTNNKFFVCSNGSTTVMFNNFSWNDTITASSWSFSNGANPATSTVFNPTVTFSQPGWASATLTVQSVHGSNTITKTNAVYVADPMPVLIDNYYYQDFNDSVKNRNWPVLNDYNSDHHWEIVDYSGYLDHSCIRFVNYDTRPSATPENAPQTPAGITGDFYTPSFDLSNFSNGTTFPPCNLTFFSAGAYRTINNAYKNDTLQVSYSINCGTTWITMANLQGDTIGNNGYYSMPYYPQENSSWRGVSLNVPNLARAKMVFFRFRYKVGSDNGGTTGYSFGTGNNFYLDRINITSYPLGVQPTALQQNGIIVTPNPTNGSATILVKEGFNGIANIMVTDITGKTVFATQQQINQNHASQIAIPAENLPAKGIYLVRVSGNGFSWTDKLVVY